MPNPRPLPERVRRAIEDQAREAAAKKATQPDADALLRRVMGKVGEIKVSVAADTGNVFVAWDAADGFPSQWRQVKGSTLAAALKAVLEREVDRDG